AEGPEADHPQRLQERVPAVPREAGVPAQGERGAGGVRGRGADDPAPADVIAGVAPAVVSDSPARGHGSTARVSHGEHTSQAPPFLVKWPAFAVGGAGTGAA